MAGLPCPLRYTPVWVGIICIILVLAFKLNSPMSSSDNKSSSSSEQKISSKEQQTLLSESEYVGVVRHPLSTYYVHKDILNIPDCKTPDFEAAPSRVHSLTTLAYLAWVGWPRPKVPGSDNPNQTTCSCGCSTNGRPHIRVRQN